MDTHQAIAVVDRASRAYARFMEVNRVLVGVPCPCAECARRRYARCEFSAMRGAATSRLWEEQAPFFDAARELAPGRRPVSEEGAWTALEDASDPAVRARITLVRRHQRLVALAFDAAKIDNQARGA